MWSLTVKVVNYFLRKRFALIVGAQKKYGTMVSEVVVTRFLKKKKFDLLELYSTIINSITCSELVSGQRDTQPQTSLFFRLKGFSWRFTGFTRTYRTEVGHKLCEWRLLAVFQLCFSDSWAFMSTNEAVFQGLPIGSASSILSLRPALWAASPEGRINLSPERCFLVQTVCSKSNAYIVCHAERTVVLMEK